MGNICTSDASLTEEEQRQMREERIRNKWIEDNLKVDTVSDQEQVKLLFLGAGESGKSTLLKQMRIINAEGYSESDRLAMRQLMYTNVLQAVKQLVKGVTDLNERGMMTSNVSTSLQADIDFVISTKLPDINKLDNATAARMRRLWQDPAIQEAYSKSSQFVLNDSAQYFLEQRLDAISKPDYVPSVEDVLRARLRTTGIVEHKFRIGDNDFAMYDVGGQRNARKKWIHCFENVTAVIFVAALSGYDQVLYEDAGQNRMNEALDLFEDICGSSWFRDTPIILFLNKKDIFRHKLENKPLQQVFSDYKPDAKRSEYDSACRFIKSEFLKRNRVPSKKIYVHRTCATDTSNIERVFSTTKAIILRRHLVEIGLMDPNAAPNVEIDNDYDSGEDNK